MKVTNLVMNRLKHLCLGWQVPGIYSSGWTQLTMEELSPGRKSKQHHFIIILRITIPPLGYFSFFDELGKNEMLDCFWQVFPFSYVLFIQNIIYLPKMGVYDHRIDFLFLSDNYVKIKIELNIFQ